MLSLLLASTLAGLALLISAVLYRLYPAADTAPRRVSRITALMLVGGVVLLLPAVAAMVYVGSIGS